MPTAGYPLLPPERRRRGRLPAKVRGIPEPIPLEACYLGCQKALELLAKLVEAEITEG